MCDILSKNTQNTENMQFKESPVKKARTHNKKRNRKARMVKYYIENPQYLDPIHEEEICFSEEDSGYLSTSTSLSEENQTSKSPTCFDFEKLQICLQKCQQKQQQPLRNINSLACGFAKHDDPSISIDPEIYCHKTSVTNFGEDAALIERYNDFEVFAVSDGVGGWNRYGVNPAKFSNALLSSVAEITSRSTAFSVNNPVDLLSLAYDNLNDMNTQITDNNDKITGGATACLAVFDKISSKLYTSNLGDSGFLVIRDLKIVHKSTPQCHHFNSPYQLSILPDEINQKLESLQSLQQNLAAQDPSNSNSNSDPVVQNVQNIQNPYYQDTPEKSTLQEFQCQENDIILLASDGLFDNVHHDQIIVLLRHLGVTQENLSSLNSEEKNQLLQKITSTFVAFARMNGYNKNFISPFAMEAKKQGVKNIIGGKVDDIAILFSVVGGLS